MYISFQNDPTNPGTVSCKTRRWKQCLGLTGRAALSAILAWNSFAGVLLLGSSRIPDMDPAKRTGEQKSDMDDPVFAQMAVAFPAGNHLFLTDLSYHKGYEVMGSQTMIGFINPEKNAATPSLRVFVTSYNSTGFSLEGRILDLAPGKNVTYPLVDLFSDNADIAWLSVESNGPLSMYQKQMVKANKGVILPARTSRDASTSYLSTVHAAGQIPAEFATLNPTSNPQMVTLFGLDADGAILAQTAFTAAPGETRMFTIKDLFREEEANLIHALSLSSSGPFFASQKKQPTGYETIEPLTPNPGAPDGWEFYAPVSSVSHSLYPPPYSSRRLEASTITGTSVKLVWDACELQSAVTGVNIYSIPKAIASDLRYQKLITSESRTSATITLPGLYSGLEHNIWVTNLFDTYSGNSMFTRFESDPSNIVVAKVKTNLNHRCDFDGSGTLNWKDYTVAIAVANGGLGPLSGLRDDNGFALYDLNQDGRIDSTDALCVYRTLITPQISPL